MMWYDFINLRRAAAESDRLDRQDRFIPLHKVISQRRDQQSEDIEIKLKEISSPY